MQVLYLKAGIIAKGKGAGLHAAAAYRAGESLRESIPGDAPSLAGKMAYDSGSVMSDGAQEKLHDYRRKEHVVTTFINAPEGAPEWAGELQSLCDAITAEETRKNARLMRKFEISLARGLSEEEQAAVCKRWCDEHFTRHGVISVVSLHNSKASDGEDNPHAHILAATRTLDADGWHADKNNIRWMNSKETLRQWRTSMGEYTNEALQAAGVDRPVTYHSYASMGIEQEVTKPLGPQAHRQEQHGITTKRGDENRRIMAERALRDELHRLKQAEGGDDGRQAWFDSFSYQFGETMDAKRDVVHRFRAKDAERRNILSDDGTNADKRLTDTFKELNANEPPDNQDDASRRPAAPPAPPPALERSDGGSPPTDPLSNSPNPRTGTQQQQPTDADGDYSRRFPHREASERTTPAFRRDTPEQPGTPQRENENEEQKEIQQPTAQEALSSEQTRMDGIRARLGSLADSQEVKDAGRTLRQNEVIDPGDDRAATAPARTAVEIGNDARQSGVQYREDMPNQELGTLSPGALPDARAPEPEQRGRGLSTADDARRTAAIRNYQATAARPEAQDASAANIKAQQNDDRMSGQDKSVDDTISQEKQGRDASEPDNGRDSR